MNACPLYLSDYRDLWERDPHAAALKWFAGARYGLFLHYGLYSLLHTNEWAQFRLKIPVSQYAALADHFTAHHFDADAIADLAVRCGMRYITFTACHHEGFCLFDSGVEPFNSLHTPARRDLVGELAAACQRRGLGFFTYYTFMLNWRHPYFVDRSVFPMARPDYETPQPEYLYREKKDFERYISYIEAVMDELLSSYPITGIWLDLIAAWYAMGEEYIPIESIYANLRRKHPHVLISWKQGATGTEDFASPENSFHDMGEQVRSQYGDAAAERAHRGFVGNRNKHNEVCSTVQRGTWAYSPLHENRSPDELYALLGHAAEHNCNLLLNVGPMADGAIHPEHVRILEEVGERIRREGYPVHGAATRNKTEAGAE